MFSFVKKALFVLLVPPESGVSQRCSQVSRHGVDDDCATMHCRPSRSNSFPLPPALVTPVVDAIVTFFFKYPARVFARGDIVLAPVVPVMILAGVAIVAVLLIVFLHARVRTLPVRDRLVLGSPRIAARGACRHYVDRRGGHVADVPRRPWVYRR